MNIDDERIVDNNENAKTKYFGTDGFRGEANVELTSLHAYKIGRFLGWYYSAFNSNNGTGKAKIVIGKDTRRSSYMLEYSIVAGITASGADAYMLHVTTTPSVSYVTRTEGFDCGIIITASHNPYYDNGIKLINRNGEKMESRIISLIESYLDGDMSKLNIADNDLPLALRDEIGQIVDHIAGRNRYVGYLISLASHSYRDLKIGLDCANGAAWSIAKAVFDALGARTFVIGATPNGTNINDGVGSTHIERLVNNVIENDLDVGFAFDGDADRCIAVDEQGNIIDGDKILYILANRYKENETLYDNTVVLTVMSNIGLLKSLEESGISYEITSVGDRFVYQRMLEKGYILGGEQSGHVIIRKYATTGDGLLTALMVTEEIKDKKCKLSKLSEKVYTYPQVTENIKVKDKNQLLTDKEVKSLINTINAELSDSGRLLLRASGTESVIRIMAESSSEEICKNAVKRIKDIIIQKETLN